MLHSLLIFIVALLNNINGFVNKGRLVTSMYVGLSLHTHDRTLINRISQGVFCVLEDHPTVNKIWIILVLTDTRTTRTR